MIAGHYRGVLSRMGKYTTSSVPMTRNALRAFICCMSCVWVAATLFLIAFWWAEWDHSAVRQRLVSCANVLSLEEDRMPLIAGLSFRKLPAFHPRMLPAPSVEDHEETTEKESQGGGLEASSLQLTTLSGILGTKTRRSGIVSLGPTQPPETAKANNQAIETDQDTAVPDVGKLVVNVDRRIQSQGSSMESRSEAPSAIDNWLMVLVLSAPSYTERREAARGVWKSMHGKAMVGKGLPPLPLSYKFICGLSTSPRVNSALRAEEKKQEDILVMKTIDSYKALAKKVLWAFQWALTNVKFQFLMKTDDDVFVNLHELFFSVFVPIDWRESQKHFYYGSTIGRYKGRGVTVKRDPQSKWYVPRSLYGADNFPPYNQGHGYILSHNLVNMTVHSAAGRQEIEVEDAYIGVLMHEDGIKPMHNAHIHDRLTRKACNDTQAILVGGLAPHELLAMIANLENSSPLCQGILPSKILQQ